MSLEDSVSSSSSSSASSLQGLGLPEWLAYIEKQHPIEIDLGLERVARVARQLECLNFDCPVISVAGTNGKGSTVESLIQLARVMGLKAGAYTSPHFVRFNERIKIGNREVADEDLVSAFETIELARLACEEKASANSLSLSYFEYATLAALRIFKQSALDLVILEVGLGGRLDAVNIIDADVAVISSIGIDHQSWLGKDRATIAIEKAGIARKHKPVVVGDIDPPKTLVKALQPSRPFFINQDFAACADESASGTWSWRGYNKDNEQVSLGSLPYGHLPINNIASACQAMSCVGLLGNEKAVSEAISVASLKGRCQFVLEKAKPLIVLDVAHNPAAALFFKEELRQKLQLLGRDLATFVDTEAKVKIILGLMSDKDLAGVVSPFLDIADEWFPCDIANERAMSAEEINTHLLACRVPVCVIPEPVEGILNKVVKQSSPKDIIIVMGSFYLLETLV